MNDKERFVEMFINHPRTHFASVEEKIDYNHQMEQHACVCDLKQRTKIFGDVLIAHRFQKIYNGVGFDYVLNNLMIGIDNGISGSSTIVLSSASFSGECCSLSAEFIDGDFRRAIKTKVDNLQQAEDALHAIGIDFSFNLKK